MPLTPAANYDIEEVVTEADTAKWRWQDARLIDHLERILATLEDDGKVEIHFPARVWTAIAGNFDHIKVILPLQAEDPKGFVHKAIADAALTATCTEPPIHLDDTVAEFGEDRMDGLSLLYILEETLEIQPRGDEPFHDLPLRARQAIASILAEIAWNDTTIANRMFSGVTHVVAASVQDPAIRAILYSTQGPKPRTTDEETGQ